MVFCYILGSWSAEWSRNTAQFCAALALVIMFVANLPFQDAACEDDECKGDLIVARYNWSRMKIKY
jgi:hypothetical protein